MTRLPKWVRNTLQGKTDYDATWLGRIQMNSHEFSDGYEIMTLVLAGVKGVKKLMRGVGRQYKDRASVCCFECRRTPTQLSKLDPIRAFLRVCGCATCRELLCCDCKATHEGIHELAGERLWNPWSEHDAQERKRLARERKNGIYTGI